jgi:ferritin-like metal-binding protein YciE
MVDRNTMVAWLNDAYAMETALIPVLQNHAKDLRSSGLDAERIELHVEQTRRHAELVKGCVEHMGSSISAVKTGLGSLFGTVQSVSTGMFADELVKNGLLDYAAEHFEIACYRALQAGATDMGDTHVSGICAEILRDEQEMADWLQGELPTLVRHTSRKSTSA